MKNNKRILFLFVYMLLFDGICAQESNQLPRNNPATNRSTWVYPGSDGKLIYRKTSHGDRILDFSHAGYMGGGVSLPSVAVVKNIRPSGVADYSGIVQNAIDEVSAFPLKNGFRGAILLAPGEYPCSRSILLHATGIVLRGSGSGPNGTTIKMIGTKHCAFIIGTETTEDTTPESAPDSSGNQKPATHGETESFHTKIVDSYVPSGATSFKVSEIEGLSVGDVVIIKRPVTQRWLNFLQMDNLKRDGRVQTFLSTRRTGNVARRIKSIDGHTITIDVPLSDSYDAQYLNPPGTIVSKEHASSTVSQVGIEAIHIQCPPLQTKYTEAPYSAIQIEGDDCWVRDVYCEETMNSTSIGGNRITMQQVVVKHTYPNLGASKPADFNIKGSQILIDRCKATGGNTYFVWTTSMVGGPNVVLNSSFSGYGSRLQPHHRWSTGLLIDNCRIPDGGIDYMNRGVAGSGHGWTMAWGVVWNCLAKSYIIQNPPGTLNWAIGNIGSRQQTARLFDSYPVIPDGEYDSFGKHVAPQSLYLAQLEERLGRKALEDIGYPSNDPAAFQDTSLQRLPDLRYYADKDLGTDRGMYRPVNANNVRGNLTMYGPEMALDGKPETYWAVDDGIKKATLEIDTEGPLDIHAIEICEAPGFEGRVNEYKVEGQVQSDWKLLSHGTTIGRSTIEVFPKETVWKVKLTITNMAKFPAISAFRIFSE